MQTSENGIAFIRANEGFAARIYNDNGKRAIGYGHDLLPGEEFPDGITGPDADALLRNDLRKRYEPVINSLIPANASQNQFDALADFAYNLGVVSLATMLHHGWQLVPSLMPRWCFMHVNGEVKQSPSLLARRQKEIELFNS